MAALFKTNAQESVLDPIPHKKDLRFRILEVQDYFISQERGYLNQNCKSFDRMKFSQRRYQKGNSRLAYLQYGDALEAQKFTS